MSLMSMFSAAHGLAEVVRSDDVPSRCCAASSPLNYENRQLKQTSQVFRKPREFQECFQASSSPHALQWDSASSQEIWDVYRCTLIFLQYSKGDLKEKCIPSLLYPKVYTSRFLLMLFSFSRSCQTGVHPIQKPGPVLEHRECHHKTGWRICQQQPHHSSQLPRHRGHNQQGVQPGHLIGSCAIHSGTH